LSIVGNRLCITIPEAWLSEAKYPVVVDPTIGTTTVGSLAYPVESPDRGSSLIYEIAVNKFLVPEKLTGQCIAWAYFSHISGNNYSYNPRVFDDDNNKPSIRRSCNEGNAWWGLWIDDDYKILPVENTPKWKSATFDIIGTLNQGSYIWFGGYGDVFYPRFDYGSLLYKAYQEYIYEDDDDKEGVEYLDFPYFGYEKTYDRKFSWYFDFISQSQNYVRTLTQGVSLSDSRIQTGDYKRNLTDTADVTSMLGRYKTSFLKLLETIRGLDSIFSPVSFMRSLHEAANNADTLKHLGEYYRGMLDNVEIVGDAKGGWLFFTKIVDTVHTAGVVFRGLLIFLRILTTSFARDDLLGRFLKARKEIVLKSCVSREIILESKMD